MKLQEKEGQWKEKRTEGVVEESEGLRDDKKEDRKTKDVEKSPLIEEENDNREGEEYGGVDKKRNVCSFISTELCGAPPSWQC
jgi:hypothetical protein